MLDTELMCMKLASMAAKEGQAEKGIMGIYVESIWKLLCLFCRTFWKVGQEDPRRVIHAFKMGLSLTLVSLLYVLEPLFDGVGQNAIWAVMTVVVVLEFTVGATLCKGLNRGLGTVLAGSLAFFIEFIANESDHVFRAVFIGSAVFLIGAAATYMKFFPYIKKNYEYGMVVFLLTFNLITVSSYRVNDVLKIAQQRFYTISIGCGICLLMSLLVFPNWSGEELHQCTVSKLEGLARSIEVCVDHYFSDSAAENGEDSSPDDPIYRAVLDSKLTEETLARHASWEPRYPRYCFRFPWKQYVKVGAALRHFGYTVVALHGCLQTEIQVIFAISVLYIDLHRIRVVLLSLNNVSFFSIIDSKSRSCSVQGPLHTSSYGSLNCSKRTCKQHKKPASFLPSILSDHLHQALQDLDTALKSQPRLFLHPTTTPLPQNTALPRVKTDNSASLELKNKEAAGERRMLRPTLSKIAITSLEFAEALPFAAFASLLVETVARLDHVIEEVEELGRIAHFKEFRIEDEIMVKCDDVKPIQNGLQNHLPSHGCE